MSNFITIPDVREDMLDRMAEDHLVLADLAFTNDDIEWAMKAAARKFNSIPPMVAWVEWNKMPLNSSVFMDGVAWALIRRWHRNVAMNDYDYNSGNVQANVQGSLLRNLGQLRDKLEQEFIKYATDLKLSINLENAYGNIG